MKTSFGRRQGSFNRQFGCSGFGHGCNHNGNFCQPRFYGSGSATMTIDNNELPAYISDFNRIVIRQAEFAVNLWVVRLADPLASGKP